MARESFAQLKAWIRTGVSPRGAHVRRTGGRCETPLSSWKTMSTVAHGEPLGVAHMEPVWQRDRIPDTKMVVVLLGGVGAASAARGELLLGVLGAETLTGDLDEVRAVGQAIEGRRREQRLAEELRPLRAIAITGQQDRAAFIPFIDDVVQILGTRGAQRFEPEVVEVEDLGLVEFGIETEVEALERLGGIEGGAAQAQAQLALGAPLDFVVQQHGEEVDEGGLLLDGLAIADVERLEDAGQAQGAEHR